MNLEDRLNEAEELRGNGRYTEALEMAKEVATTHPDNAEAWWLVGLAAHSLKRLPEALAALEEATRLAPRVAQGWAQYGVVLDESGQTPAAKQALHRAIEIEANYPSAHRQLARILEREGDLDGRILHLTRVDELGEASANDLNQLGLAHRRKKRFADALGYLLRAGKLTDTHHPFFNLALVYTDSEVSQNIDAADSLRRALARKPDYPQAIQMLSELEPRLSKLAREVLEQGETPLHSGEHFRFYLNPLELIGCRRDQDTEDPDAEKIQRLKTAVLEEIDLKDGRLQHLGGVVVDKSRAIEICEELCDENLKRYHRQVFKNPFLLRFMTRGDIRQFLHIDNYFPGETLEELKDDGFREWLSGPFARQYDLVLTRALERNSALMVESLFDGRRWVIPPHDEICFEGARRQIARLLEPLKSAAKRAGEAAPDPVAVENLLTRDSLLEILNLLPAHFHDQQAEAVQCIREMFIAAHDDHDNADLSKAILLLSKRFSFKSAVLSQRLKDDFSEIKESIQEERKHEVMLAAGDEPMGVTKDGVRRGHRFLPADHVRSVRWGLIITSHQHSEEYKYVMAFRDENRKETVLSWRAWTNFDQQEKLFQKLVEAVLHYIVPKILVGIQDQLSRGEAIRIANCTVRRDGVSVETRGWFSTKTRTIPWSQLATGIEKGQFRVYDRVNPGISASMPMLDAENAVLLHLFAKGRISPVSPV